MYARSLYLKPEVTNLGALQLPACWRWADRLSDGQKIPRLNSVSKSLPLDHPLGDQEPLLVYYLKSSISLMPHANHGHSMKDG